MQIGRYEAKMIDAGRYRLDGGAMFGVVPKVLWQKTFPPDDKNRIHMALNTLLLITEGKNILIDTGIGTKLTKKFAEIYAVDYSEHDLLKSLADQGLQKEDITDVILTHLHFDHVGGATYYDRDEKLQLQFPNATHYVQKKQLEWAKSKSEKDRASYLSENVAPLVESRQLKILEGAIELFPDVEILLSDGHTYAQQMVLIKGENRSLLYTADLIPTSAHIPVPWIMAYDLNPVDSIHEKKMILERAVKENWLLFFEHDPEVYCGTVEETEKGYKLKNSVRL